MYIGDSIETSSFLMYVWTPNGIGSSTSYYKSEERPAVVATTAGAITYNGLTLLSTLHRFGTDEI